MEPPAAYGDDPGSPDQLRRLLAGHRAAGGREAESMRRVAAELERLTRPCDKEADAVHVTASAVVVGRRGTLLLRHRRLLRWLQPGGHIDPGESPPAAALREAQEETGLALAHPGEGPLLLQVDVHEATLGHTHLDLRYLLVGPDADPAPPPGESPDVRWYDWADAEEIADASLAEGLRAARVLAPVLVRRAGPVTGAAGVSADRPDPAAGGRGDRGGDDG